MAQAPHSVQLTKTPQDRRALVPLTDLALSTFATATNVGDFAKAAFLQSYDKTQNKFLMDMETCFMRGTEFFLLMYNREMVERRFAVASRLLGLPDSYAIISAGMTDPAGTVAAAMPETSRA